MRTLIIGFGNPLRGDDGIGWVAAEQLANKISDPGIRVLARHQLTAELAVDAAQVERLVLIDAAQDGKPGRVLVEKIRPCETMPSTFSHQLSPIELLACARQWFGSAPETWLVSVDGESFEHGDQLSDQVAVTVPVVIARVLQIAEMPCTS